MEDTKGVICLRAQIVSCQISKDKHEEMTESGENYLLNEKTIHNSQDSRYEFVSIKAEWSGKRFIANRENYCKFDGDREDGVEFVFLRVASYKFPTMTRSSGLVLRNEGDLDNLYQRVGTGWLQGDGTLWDGIESSIVHIR